MKLIYIFTVLLILTPLTKTSSNTVTLSFNPDIITAQKGEECAISLFVNPGSYGISGGEVHLKADPSIILIKSVEIGGLVGNNPLTGLDKMDVKNGTVVLAIARIGPTVKPTAPATMLTLKFSILDSAKTGSYSIDIVQVGFTDSEITDIPLTFIKKSSCIVSITGPNSSTTSIDPSLYILSPAILLGIMAAVVILQITIKRKKRILSSPAFILGKLFYLKPAETLDLTRARG